MLNRLIRFSLNNRYWVLGVTLVLVGLGMATIPRLPIDAVPDITNIQVVVNTKTGALDPEKIEMLVTRPIETEVGGLPDLEELRSISKYGLSQVTLVFADGTDIYWARQQVAERIQNARKSLPAELTPELGPITTGLGEVFMYSVEAEPGSSWMKLPEEQRLTELRTIQDYQIRPVLRRVEGVADVDSNGGYQKEIHINFFPARLERAGISVEQLTQRLETLGENYGGGYIQMGGNQIIVRTVPGIPKLQDLRVIPLGLDVQGRPIRLSEVAEIREEHALRVGAATRDGRETVLGTVLMRVGANSRRVAQDSAAALAELKLPPGVKAVPLYSRSFLVNATIRTVARNLTEGAILVVTVLLLLLGNVRAAVIVALAIPISVLIAARGMFTLGISGNLMSLGAIDFGLLVDGSVVLIENVLSRMVATASKTELTREQKTEVVYHGATEVVRPVVFGLVMIMIVYVPILTLQGIEGKMFRPMAITVLMALGASLAIAVFLMPVLADLLIPMPRHREKAEHETALFRFLKRLYLPSLLLAIRRRWFFIVPALGLVVLSLILMARMGADFIPKLDEGDLVIVLARDAKIGINRSVLRQKEVERILMGFPEVDMVFSRMGTPESATDPMGVNLADTFIILRKDRSQWRHPSKEALFDEMGKALLSANPEQELSATQPIEMRFNEILEGSRADVTLRVLGLDLSTLLVVIGQAKDEIEKIPGAESVSFDPLTALKKSPMLDLMLNYEAAARYGIDLGDVNRLFELAMSGKEIGSFFQGGVRFPIVVHLDESLRNRVEAIRNIPVGLPQGGTIPLQKLADFSLQEHVTTIARSWGNRYAAISINLKGRDVDSFVREAQARIAERVPAPKGFQYYWGGQFKNLARARATLWVIVPATLLAVFLILLRNFESIAQTLLIFSSIPFATVGGVFSLLFRGINMSVSAAVGFIALIGIALLNGIVLLTVFNSLREKEDKPLKEIIVEGALSRLRPVMMTALVASLGFLPMALNTGLGAEVQRPLATVVIGGLATSTLLTLVILPAAYLMLETARDKRRASRR